MFANLTTVLSLEIGLCRHSEIGASSQALVSVRGVIEFGLIVEYQ